MTVDAKLSFDLVESKSHREYVKTLNQNAPVVNRRTLIRNIDAEYSRTLAIVEKDWHSVDRVFSITYDG